MSTVHYCFIARDSDMIVFECLVTKDLKQPQLKSISVEILTRKEKEYASTLQRMNSSTASALDPEQGEDIMLFKEPCPQITGGVEIHVLLQQGVWFGIFTEVKYNEAKAKGFLQQLHKEMDKLYKGNLAFMRRQGNLKPNVYDKPFKASFQKTLDNNATGISSKNLNAAQ